MTTLRQQNAELKRQLTDSMTAQAVSQELLKSLSEWLITVLSQQTRMNRTLSGVLK
ncbi:MAG: hypothetical protein AAF215_05765 [Cyanobacteria bacterium P01_A01_bin.123]